MFGLKELNDQAIFNNNRDEVGETFKDYPLNTPLSSSFLSTLPLRVAIESQVWNALDYFIDRGEALEKEDINYHYFWTDPSVF